MTEPVSKLWPALLRARMKIKRIAKSSTNPHFGSAYTSLEEIYAHTNKELWSEGLVLSNRVSTDPLVLCVAVVHAETGERVESFVPLVGATDMQKLGGAMTYAARYGAANLLGLELEGTDDDGNTASAPAARQAAPQRPVSAPARPEAQGRAPARPQGTGRGAARTATPRPDDAATVWALARALDTDAEDRGEKFRIVQGGKLGVFGKVADNVGIVAGKYEPEAMPPEALAKLRGFYEYLCKKNDIHVPDADDPDRFLSDL